MTSMMTDFEVVDLEAFEFDIECEPRKMECGAPAVWLMIKTCCGNTTPLCTAHYDMIRKTLDGMTNNLMCTECGAFHGKDCYRWERI